MSERVTIPTEADKVSWAEGGSAYPSTDPGAGKRQIGYQPKDNPVPGPGEIITAEEQNFLHRLDGQMLAWLRDTIEREWRDVHEGITGQSSGGGLCFKVVPPLGSPFQNYGRLQTAWTTASTAATGGNPVLVQTDGEQIYYVAGSTNQSLVAASPVAGAEIWESGVVTQFDGFAVDGAAVYAFSTNVAEPGLFVINRTTGLQTSNAGAEYSCSRAVANGVYCCGINGAVGGAGSMVFYTIATPTETGTVTPFLAAATDLAIDNDTVYTCGPRNVDDVFAYTLSTRALLWSVTVDGNVFSSNCIATDGDCIYVGTDSAALAAGGTASIFCLDRVNGNVLWTSDVGNVDSIAVDDRYLYAVTDGNVLWMLRLRGMGTNPVPLASISGFGSGTAFVVDSDGYAIYGSDSGTPANFRKVWVGGAAKAYQLAGGNDPNRRPFFKLAVPVDGRI